MKITLLHGEYVSILFLTQHEGDLGLSTKVIKLYEWIFILCYKRRRHKIQFFESHDQCHKFEKTLFFQIGSFLADRYTPCIHF